MIFTVPVDNFTISYHPESKQFTYKNGNEVTSQTLINKASVKLADANGRLVKVEYNSSKYAILPGKRIISLQSSSAGKEVFKSSSDGRRQVILATANWGEKLCLS